MNIVVTGKHLDVGSSFRTYIEENLTQTMEKYFSSPIDATVVISHEADHFIRTDLSVHPGRGISIRVHGTAHKPYPSFDQALEKLENQFRRYKDRLKSHHHNTPLSETFSSATQYIIQDASDHDSHKEEAKPVTIAEMTAPLLTLTVGEAVMHLDLSDAPVIVFYNKGSNSVNVVYRRKDGNIGWIDPQISSQKPSSQS
jgi:ribosomal subunit interface protein